MAAVLEVIRLGRSARTEAGIKVRQPLQGIKVYTREPEFMEVEPLLKEALKSSENPDMCPVCRTVHASGTLLHLIEELTSGPETTREVKALAESRIGR